MSSEEDDGPYAFEKKVICVHDTGDSLKVTPIHPHRPIPFYVPKSVIHDDSEVYAKGHEGKLVVKNWWANKTWAI